MNSISFKAQFEGMNNYAVKFIFEKKTEADTKHKVVFIKGYEHFGDDVFELYTNGKKTAEHKTEILNEQSFSPERLMGIFNILKTKEAKAKIEKLRSKK